MKKILKTMFLTAITTNNNLMLANFRKKVKFKNDVHLNVLTKIVIALNIGFDASVLNNRDTIGDCLSWLEVEIKKIDPHVKLKLKNPRLVNQRLKIKTNKFFVNLILDKIAFSTIVVVKNVQECQVLTITEKIRKVIEHVTIFNHVKFTNGDNVATVLKAVNKFATQLINTPLKIRFPKEKQLAQKLAVGTNKFLATITILNQRHDFLMTIVDVKDQEFLELQHLKQTLATMVINAKVLTTNNNFRDALNLIKKKVINNDNQKTKIELQLPTFLIRKLKSGTNLIALNLERNHNYQKVIVKLIDVQLSRTDELVLVKKINQILTQEFSTLFSLESKIEAMFYYVRDVIQTVAKNSSVILNSQKNHNWIKNKTVIFDYYLNSNRCYQIKLALKKVSCDDNHLFEIVSEKLAIIDGSQLLDNNNTYQDAINLIIKDVVKSYAPKMTVILDTNNQLLKSGNNEFLVTLVEQKNSYQSRVIINNVGIADSQWLNLAAKKITKDFFKTEVLTTDQTTLTVVNTIKEKCHTINKNIKIALGAKTTVRKLCDPKDEVAIELTLGFAKKNFNVVLTNIIKSNHDLLKLVIHDLQRSGFLKINDWDTSKTYQDVINFIANKMTVPNIKIKLISRYQAVTDHLKKGNSTLDLQLELFDEVLSTRVVIKNIRTAHADILATIISSLNLTIINFNTSQTYQDVIDFIKSQLVMTSKVVKLELVAVNPMTKINADQKIIYVKFWLYNATKLVPVRLINPMLTDFDLLTKVTNELKHVVLVNKTTDNTYQDILDEVWENMELVTSQLETRRVVIKLEDHLNTEKLKLGDNLIRVNFSVNNDNEVINILVSDVTLSTNNIIQQIKNIFREPLDLTLTTDHCGKDVLQKLLAKLCHEISSEITVQFYNASNLDRNLRVHCDQFNILVKVKNQKTTLLMLRLENIIESALHFSDRISNFLSQLAIKNKSTITTYQEIINEISAIIQKKVSCYQYQSLSIKLGNKKQSNKKLSVGDNYIQVILQVARVVKLISIRVLDVFETHKDILKRIKINLDKNIIGWDTSQTYYDVLNEVKARIKNPEVKLSFDDKQQNYWVRLSKNTIFLLVKLQLGIVTTTVMINIINLKLAANDISAILKTRLNTLIVNKTTQNCYQHVVTELYLQLKRLFVREEIPQFKIKLLKISNLLERLTIGTHKIQAQISFQNQSYQPILLIKNVKASTTDLLVMINNIFDSNLDLNVTTNHTKKDILLRLQRHFQNEIYEQRIKVLIANCRNIKTKLTKDSDTINVQIRIDQKTFIKKINLINIKEVASDILKRIIKLCPPNVYDLTTNHTYNDVLKEVQARFQKLLLKTNPYSLEVSIQNSLNGNDFLIASNNTGIMFYIKLDSKTVPFKVNLLNVIKTDCDILKTTLNSLSKTITNWDTSKTNQDVLNEITMRIGNPQIKLAIVEPLRSNQNLSYGIQEIKLQCTLNRVQETIVIAIDVNHFVATDIIKMLKQNLEPTIANLTTTNCYQDILRWFNEQLKLIFSLSERQRIQVDFNSAIDKASKIALGTTNLFLRITVDDISDFFKITLLNVKLAADCLLKKITKIFKDMRNVYWTTTTTHRDVLMTVREQLRIMLLEDYDRINLELTQNSHHQLKLTPLTEKLEFKIIIDDEKSQNINLIFKNIVDEMQQLLEIELAKINFNIFGKTTQNTFNDIFKEIKAQMAPDLELIGVGAANQKLSAGNNEIKAVVIRGRNSKTLKINVNDVTLSDNDQLEIIIKKLNLTISNWETDRTYKDVINNLAQKINNQKVIIVYENQELVLSDKIPVGTYQLKLELQLNDTIKPISVDMVAVKVTDHERMAEVLATIKQQIFNKTTANTYSEILAEIMTPLNQTDRVTISLLDKKIAQRKLAINDHQFMIKVKVKNLIEVIPIQVLNVTEATTDILNRSVNGWVKILTDLKTSNTYEDILNYVIKNVNHPAIKVSFKNKNIKLKEHLEFGEYFLDFIATLEEVSTEITINVLQVLEADIDIVKRIAQTLPSVISNKTTACNYGVIFEELKNQLSGIDREKIFLKDWTELKVTLISGDNNLNIVIKSGTAIINKTILIEKVLLANDELENQIQEVLAPPLKFTTITASSTPTDIINEVQEVLQQKMTNHDFLQIKKITLVLKQLNDRKLYLLRGWNNNELDLAIKIKLPHTEKRIIIKIVNIKVTDEYHLHQAVTAIEKLNPIVNLTTSDSVLKILKMIQNEFINQPNVVVMLKRKTFQKLLVGDNVEDLIVKVNDYQHELKLLIKNVTISHNHLIQKIKQFLADPFDLELFLDDSFQEALKRWLVKFKQFLTKTELERCTNFNVKYESFKFNEFKNDYVNDIVMKVSFMVDEKLITQELKLINIRMTDEQLITAIELIFENNSNLAFTTDSTYCEVLAKLQTELKLKLGETTYKRITKFSYLDNHLPTALIKFVTTQPLQSVFWIKLMINNFMKELSISINNIKKSDQYLFNEVQELLKNNLNLELRTEDSFREVLIKIEHYLEKIIGKSDFQRLAIKVEDNKFLTILDEALGKYLPKVQFKLMLWVKNNKQQITINLTNILKTKKYLENEIILQRIQEFLNYEYDWKISWNDSLLVVFQKLQENLQQYLSQNRYQKITSLGFEDQNDLKAILAPAISNKQLRLSIRVTIDNIITSTATLKLANIKTIDYHDILRILQTIHLEELKLILNASNNQIIKFFQEKLNWKVQICSSPIAENIIMYAGKQFKIVVVPMIGLQIIPFNIVEAD